MIELSKCPNCASEDRVTIAGKEFCMRCGTPSEDNAMISASDSQSTQPAEQPSQVSKFSDAPSVQAPLNDQQVTQAPPNAAQPTIPAAASVVQTEQPLNDSAAQNQPAMPSAQPSVVADQPAIAEMPFTAQPQPMPVATTPDNAVGIANSAPQGPANPVAVQTPLAQDSAIAQADSKIDELTNSPSPQSNNSNPVISTLPQDSIQTGSIEQTTTASSAPMGGAAAQSSPIMQQQASTEVTSEAAVPIQANTIDSISATPPVSKTMPGVGSTMSLDKSEPGVFSDEELHALSNTTVESPSPIVAPQASTASGPTPIAATGPMPQLPQATGQTMTQPQSRPMQLPLPSTDNASQDSQPKQSKSKKVLKPVGVVASIALLFAAGYYMWRVNYPGLAFKIASSKAGINATMPGYVPDGYSLKGNIQANPGAVSYSLTNQNSKKIAISQSKTDWDSQALAENYVSPKAENYLAVQAQGLTIYMMGSNQASWVNKGTWYRVESPDQPLTQEQVVKLATSL